ncbi:MAG: zinc-binding dehydrogenase, partial [Acidobacteriota bacterium]
KFARAVRELTGEGANAVIEIVGSVTFDQSLKALAPGGRLVVVGNLETGIVRLNPGLVIVKELELIGAYATTQSELQDALQLIEDGVLRPWVSGVLPLADAWQAHQRLEDREVVGRLVLEPTH